MQQIHRLDSIAEIRHVVEAVVKAPKRKLHAMTTILNGGRTFGRVPMRSFTGSKGRVREAQPWHWQPKTLREAETFRNKREDRGSHLLRWTPRVNASIQKPLSSYLSFYERNMFNRYGKLPCNP